jgi:hypothetical protein
MASFLDRAMDWRRRAAELRTVAETMMTAAARSSLLDMAAALEHHAGNLEQTAGKFACARQTAAAVVHRRHFPRQRLQCRPGSD